MTDRTDDDAELAAFLGAMADVRRHKSAARVELRAPLPLTRPRQQDLDDLAVLAEMLDGPDPETFESGDTLTYRAPGLPDSAWRQLRRGIYRIEAELDLHGHNRNTARLAIVTFLANCHERRQRCVRIIHGKGNGSPNSGPVLKVSLDGWLRKRRDVMAFATARPVDGGTGAVYVLLRPLKP